MWSSSSAREQRAVSAAAAPSASPRAPLESPGPGPTCRERGAGAAPHRQPVEARGSAGGHLPAAAVGRAVAAEALCGEMSRALRAARAAPAAPGRSPARPPPSPRGCSPSRARPLSPTKPGRHSPSAPRAAPSSSEPSSSTARSILGAEGEEPPPARPRSSALLGAAARPAPALPSPVNKRRAALPPPPRGCRRVLTLPPPAPRRGRGGCRGAGLGAAANLLPQRVLCPGTEHGDGCSVSRGSLAREELRVPGLVSYSRRKSLRLEEETFHTELRLNYCPWQEKCLPSET